MTTPDERERQLEKAEQAFVEKSNKERRLLLKKEYLDVKNIGVILIDFVPYERKNQMIEGLKRLFTHEDLDKPLFSDTPRIEGIPDIRESGMLSGGGHANIGTIVNSDLGAGLLVTAIQRRLPAEIQAMQVFVGQFVDYAYYVVYSCLIKDDYQNKGIEQIFTESDDWVPYYEKTSDGEKKRGERRKGPEHEPTIRTYQENIEQFLRPFSCGLFLNTDNNQTGACPSLKIVSIPHIDFAAFEQWEKTYRGLLVFLGFNFLYSKFEHTVVGFYRKSLFPGKPSSVFQGLIFLASLDNFKGEGYGTPANEILSRIEFFATFDLARLFHVVYWPAYHIEVIQKEWKRKTCNLLITIRDLKRHSKSALNKVYNDVLDAYGSYNQYYLDETENIKTLIEELRRFEKFVSEAETLAGFTKFSIFYELLAGGKRFLNREKDNLDELKGLFDDLFRHCNDFVNMALNDSNLRLQRLMKNMTIAMLLLTAVTVAVPIVESIIESYGSLIWNWLQNLTGSI